MMSPREFKLSMQALMEDVEMSEQPRTKRHCLYFKLPFFNLFKLYSYR
ncbi:MAG: hypothetical protein LPK26_01775 [Bacillaceae bacterium]|nr:hypothetical protein [Bacillaceae bacterium]